LSVVEKRSEKDKIGINGVPNSKCTLRCYIYYINCQEFYEFIKKSENMNLTRIIKYLQEKARKMLIFFLNLFCNHYMII